MPWYLQKTTNLPTFGSCWILFLRGRDRDAAHSIATVKQCLRQIYSHLLRVEEFFCLFVLLFKLLDNISAGHLSWDNLIKVWVKSTQVDLSLEQQKLLLPRISVRTNVKKIKIIDVQNSPKTFSPQRPGWAQLKHTDMHAYEEGHNGKPLQTQCRIGPKQSQT